MSIHYSPYHSHPFTINPSWLDFCDRVHGAVCPNASHLRILRGPCVWWCLVWMAKRYHWISLGNDPKSCMVEVALAASEVNESLQQGLHRQCTMIWSFYFASMVATIIIAASFCIPYCFSRFGQGLPGYHLIWNFAVEDRVLYPMVGLSSTCLCHFGGLLEEGWQEMARVISSVTQTKSVSQEGAYSFTRPPRG